MVVVESGVAFLPPGVVRHHHCIFRMYMFMNLPEKPKSKTMVFNGVRSAHPLLFRVLFTEVVLIMGIVLIMGEV